MREIEIRLLDQIDKQQRDLINLYNAAVGAIDGPPSAHDIRLQALAQAVKARGAGIPTEKIVETAQGFENYLRGSATT